jgi:hypothetical protein
MNVSLLTALIEARRLINNGWIQKTFAKDAHGYMCDWGSEAARSFCSIGAIYRATDWRSTYNTDLCMRAFEALAENMYPGYGDPSGHIARYNDARGRTKEEVLEAFDRSIAAQIKIAPVDVRESEELECV